MSLIDGIGRWFGLVPAVDVTRRAVLDTMDAMDATAVAALDTMDTTDTTAIGSNVVPIRSVATDEDDEPDYIDAYDEAKCTAYADTSKFLDWVYATQPTIIGITRGRLWSLYWEYCARFQFRPVTRKTLETGLTRHCHKRRPRIGNKRRTVYDLKARPRVLRKLAA